MKTWDRLQLESDLTKFFIVGSTEVIDTKRPCEDGRPPAGYV